MAQRHTPDPGPDWRALLDALPPRTTARRRTHPGSGGAHAAAPLAVNGPPSSARYGGAP
ncbi:hypothetical protein [Streptomyces fulvorobeus]|uniref:hypothetical protein n=1 Tax=Streptomyces fulvorobeus TaxID=284028 RepID=UPI001565E1E5|nr:hypothetical protein [Streptomyces fulvorobeus]